MPPRLRQSAAPWTAWPSSHSVRCIELAYALGIPTMRVNTGTWGTSKNFDELMKNKGIEAPLEGHTDEEAFAWVIDGLGAMPIR